MENKKISKELKWIIMISFVINTILMIKGLVFFDSHINFFGILSLISSILSFVCFIIIGIAYYIKIRKS